MASTPPRSSRHRVHVVSDVHGNARDLARAGEGADALICLGDLVLFLDYADHSRGIFPDLFGEANADRIVELRTARRFEQARAFGAELWGGCLLHTSPSPRDTRQSRMPASACNN